MTIGELSSLCVIKFTRKYLKGLCIGGFIAQEVNKNHSYSIYWMIDQKLWRKKTFSMRGQVLSSKCVVYKQLRELSLRSKHDG